MVSKPCIKIYMQRISTIRLQENTSSTVSDFPFLLKVSMHACMHAYANKKVGSNIIKKDKDLVALNQAKMLMYTDGLLAELVPT
jgi:hypothetical protein